MASVGCKQCEQLDMCAVIVMFSLKEQDLQQFNHKYKSLGNAIHIKTSKRALFWPTPQGNSKKRTKEKIPSVVSSAQWHQYYESKEKKKNKIQAEEKRRLEERIKKNEVARKLKTAQKLAKKSQKAVKRFQNKVDNDSDTSTEEEWLESGDS
ncbi:unnamed protein product [Arctia plantaginis]|uniref:Uncharacterized protein n=1 Tax=Arctia plantaginis TaxID=874455 RepID=A0A8S1ATG8_ARCPL|nr:unnamed protein product [Arctia plantaginis]